MNRLALRLGLSSLAAVGVSLAAAAAHADSTNPASSCSTTLECSSGQAALKASSRTRLATTVSTGWLPKCSNGQDHCSGQPLQVQADIALDAPDDAQKALYEIDMQKGAIVNVTWPDKDAFTLKLENGARTDGSFAVNHTLVPNVKLYVGLVLHQEFSFDATQLISKIPGSHFNYLGTGTGTFAPWALDGSAQTDVKGPDLSNSQLFSVPIESLPGVGSLLAGTLALSATTNPTFTYKTTKVTIAGAGAPLSGAAPTGKIKGQNADFIDLLADVEGEISYKGTMEVLPDVTITKAGPLSGLNLSIPISVGAKTDYDNGAEPVIVSFPRQTVHVPLPNVFVPTEEVDFGAIKTGTQAEKTVAVNNTGELGAILSIESSDPQFVVATAQVQMAHKSKSDLVVRFQPTAAGDASATITVKSNDPDSPVQTFTVKGSSSPQAKPGGGTNGGEDPSPPQPNAGASSGCGCRVTSPSTGNAAGGAFLVMATFAFLRRRRAAK